MLVLPCSVCNILGDFVTCRSAILEAVSSRCLCGMLYMVQCVTPLLLHMQHAVLCIWAWTIHSRLYYVGQVGRSSVSSLHYSIAKSYCVIPLFSSHGGGLLHLDPGGNCCSLACPQQAVALAMEAAQPTQFAYGSIVVPHRMVNQCSCSLTGSESMSSIVFP